MKFDLGDNVTHILTLAIIGAVAILVMYLSKGTIDTTTLLLGFIGVAGPLTGVHLANSNNSANNNALSNAISSAVNNGSPAAVTVAPAVPAPMAAPVAPIVQVPQAGGLLNFATEKRLAVQKGVQNGPQTDLKTFG